MGSVVAQLFPGLSRDVRAGSSPGSGWATQGHSETCSKATPDCSRLWTYEGFLAERSPDPVGAAPWGWSVEVVVSTYAPKT